MKEKKICLVEGCEKEAISKGMCRVHYHRKWRYGDPLFRMTHDNSGQCLHPGCNRKAHSRGYCEKHYQRVKHHGDSNCLKIELHGKRHTPEYKVWAEMKQRCYNPNKERYPNYGGRGITVCERWLNSFAAFYADMGDRPSKNHQIDRIDNDGNYEKLNCKWATRKENGRHTTRTVLSMKKADEIRSLYKTTDKSQREIAKMYNTDQGTVCGIIHNKIWA